MIFRRGWLIGNGLVEGGNDLDLRRSIIRMGLEIRGRARSLGSTSTYQYGS